MADWKFHRRQGLCAPCGHEFVIGETFFSVLQLEEEDFLRGDLCAGCFDQRNVDQDLVWWRTTHAEAKGGLKLDFEAILALFGALKDKAGESPLDLRFLLGLLLVRHRKLKLIGVKTRGKQELLQLRKPRSQQIHEVEVRELSEDRRKTLTAALGELMDPTHEGGLGDLLKEPKADSDSDSEVDPEAVESEKS